MRLNYDSATSAYIYSKRANIEACLSVSDWVQSLSWFCAWCFIERDLRSWDVMQARFKCGSLSERKRIVLTCLFSFPFYLYYLLVVVFYESVETFLQIGWIACFIWVPFLRVFLKVDRIFLSQNWAKAYETMCYLRILQRSFFELSRKVLELMLKQSILELSKGNEVLRWIFLFHTHCLFCLCSFIIVWNSTTFSTKNSVKWQLKI